MKKLVILALILSAITGLTGFQYMKNLEKKFQGKTMPVVVAKSQIPMYTKITSDMVEIRNISVDAVNPLSLSAIDKILGKATKVPIEAYEQVLSTKLIDSEENNGSLSYSIKEGYRALTIKTDEITGIAGRIVKGDHIDMVATMISQTNGTSGLDSVMVAENIEVLDVGIKQSGSEEEAPYTSVTLSVRVEEILKINYALTEGKYRLVLRSVVDKDLKNIPGYVVK